MNFCIPLYFNFCFSSFKTSSSSSLKSVSPPSFSSSSENCGAIFMSLFLLCLGNHTYTIANFQIQPNEMLFKTSAHKYALKFNSGTSLGNFNKHAIPPKLIKFTPFEEIISREWKKNMLIGRICSSLHTFQ
ncbi:uncharacterized protein LOC127138788 isoform X6 [Lathyrus oleraceus]|uniref:uncharacterized protein LOC127138788 isoform X1 n=1 Tax=Pisum sativum TaxID=3888 RepID=UPI0021CF1E75|nr:uncharacterized protein LOC127138788 isoform X1 [Pisum sativum]XP_050921270.1 uncharacterized protein LOC127138788 isoform X2 [Pisum sativum]XP_050921272.1 uncharacterized protein LOC127138788 isoform X3 [Pisum sativum]XP_050921273.1 uncharacterized protein LOC127138788 isoform X4 [Pisum sativum]XP_050921274.1 uncharacterized protein LOC127138788 isoform X5 [Pisum sativum]XP_050921275.1 uncharacterized protein LOC127138788 isoform X6 [Pisum sativum]